MAEERIISPRPYTYGRLDVEGNRRVAVTYDDKTFSFNDVSRYYLAGDGFGLTVFQKGNRQAVVNVKWSAHSDRVIVRTGGAPVITRNVAVHISEGSDTIVVA